MSSWKNSGNARAHKERAQPASRDKHGLLEKHKDYVLRARDYHKKEKRLRALKEKAFFKNPDEFYFKMTSSTTEEGVHKNSKKRLDSTKMRKLTKQDIGYISLRRQMEDKKIKQIQSSLHFTERPNQNSHVVFAENDEDERVISEELSKDKELKKPVGDRVVERKRADSYKELALRLERKRKLSSLEEKLEAKHNLMGKGQRKKVKGANGRVAYRWKAVRQK